MGFGRQGKKNRKLFWVPAIAPLISVVLSTFFVYITRADKQGVQIVSISFLVAFLFLLYELFAQLVCRKTQINLTYMFR